MNWFLIPIFCHFEFLEVLHINRSAMMRRRGPWVRTCAIGCFTIGMTNNYVCQIVAYNLDGLNGVG